MTATTAMSKYLKDREAVQHDVPERTHLRIGFVPLTDCAPLVVASMLDLGKRHGLTLELCRQPSWAAVRDKLLSGELDAAQALYGMAYGVQLGLGGPQADMAILMTLNRNGQAITVSNPLVQVLQQGQTLKSALAALGRKPVFAQTFPTGTHAMWLNYWLAAQGVHPLRDVESIVIPPPQMPEALLHGELDGFCAGEPWHAVAEQMAAGRTLLGSGEIWPNHPEKALICRREFTALYPNTARALIRTVLEACQWLEDSANRTQAADWLALPQFLNLPSTLIAPRLLGEFGAASLLGPQMPLRFFDQAGLNRPRPSDGLWFLSQYRRWGMYHATTDWTRIANEVSQTELYDDAARSLGLTSDTALSTTSVLIDGRVWDGVNALDYADSFDISA